MPSEIKTHTDAAAAAVRLPLPTLLSQVLVAFTIEFDNEFERRMPHRTTRPTGEGAAAFGPWLVSLAMWSNLLRFVSDQGIRVRELEDQGGNLAGMKRWGYVSVAPDPSDHRAKPPERDWIVRLTAKGRKAAEVWRPLFGDIERRWEERFDRQEVENLRELLGRFVRRLDRELPAYLPVLHYGLVAHPPEKIAAAAEPGDGEAAGRHLPALLSKVLLAFTLEFEQESRLSLAICANVMRVLNEKGVPVRELPRLSGISKEAIKMALGFLQNRGLITIAADPSAARSKLVRLAAKGRAAQNGYRQLLRAIEARWQERFGKEDVFELRECLQRFVGDPGAESSPLFRGLDPPPGGWRVSVRKPETLPHYPMVLHRGGYPDGS